MSLDLNTTSRMSQMLKLSQRQQYILNQLPGWQVNHNIQFLGFAQKAFNNTSISNKMNKAG